MTFRHVKSLVLGGLTGGMIALSSTSALAATTLGTNITTATNAMNSFPALLTTIAYISGIFLCVAGILKLKQHVDTPQQVRLHEGVMRFIAGGLFLSLPFFSSAVYGTIFGGGMTPFSHTSFHAAVGAGSGALDDLFMKFIQDVAPSMAILIDAFSYIAGIALLLVGISRLTKSMQEGPRGPAGMGTIMTFIAAGVLMSSAQMIGTMSSSLFGTPVLNTYAVISSSVISNATTAARIDTVIESMMTFIMLVGYIAFIRGWFVLKAFADGAQGTSLAQGLTFIIGGTIAINLGNLINALSNTLGLTSLTFS